MSASIDTVVTTQPAAPTLPPADPFTSMHFEFRSDKERLVCDLRFQGTPMCGAILSAIAKAVAVTHRDGEYGGGGRTGHIGKRCRGLSQYAGERLQEQLPMELKTSGRFGLIGCYSLQEKQQDSTNSSNHLRAPVDKLFVDHFLTLAVIDDTWIAVDVSARKYLQLIGIRADADVIAASSADELKTALRSYYGGVRWMEQLSCWTAS